jgi:hypothetical protein
VQSDEPQLYASLRTAEEMARGVQLTFLDLPGAADAGLSPADKYQPGLPAQRDSDTDYLAHYRAPDVIPTFKVQPGTSPLTLLDFCAPFAHFFSVLLAGKVMALIAPFLPSLFPSTTFVGAAANYISLAALFYGFFRVLFRNYTGRFGFQLRRRRRPGRLGRRILRRFGRRGWFLWYLTLPLWWGLLLGLLSPACFVTGAFARGVWDYLTAPSPPPAPEPVHINIFGGEEPGFAKALRSFMWLTKLLAGGAGLIFLFFGTVNLMTDRPFIKYYMNAGMSFSMILMLWLFESMSRATPVYDLGVLGN